MGLPCHCFMHSFSYLVKVIAFLHSRSDPEPCWRTLFLDVVLFSDCLLYLKLFWSRKLKKKTKIIIITSIKRKIDESQLSAKVASELRLDRKLVSSPRIFFSIKFHSLLRNGWPQNYYEFHENKMIFPTNKFCPLNLMLVYF